MEHVDQLAEESIQENLGNLNIRRHEETDSEVTDSDLEEEEIQETMAEALQRAHLSRR